MKAVYYEAFGSSDVLKIGNIELPQLTAGEVQIKISHTAVNPVDWKIREGYLQSLMPHVFPLIPGWDVAGEIVELGSSVTDFQIGEKVFAYARKPVVQFGTYAEMIHLDQTSIVQAPKSIGPEKAAGLPLVALTAWQGLVNTAKVKASDKVLITAGAGGVGSLAIQFAKHAGADVYTTASQHNHDYLKSLGADHAIDYHQGSVVDQIKALTPEGIDVVFDGAGGTALNDAWQLVKSGGRLVSIVDTPDQTLAREKMVSASFVFVVPNGEELREIANLIDQGKVQPPATEVRNIKEAAAALDENQQRHVRGKVVLEVNF